MILINILRAKNIVQQIQQKYNKIFSIIVNVEKNTLIALPFSVRLFQLIFFLVSTTSRVTSYYPLYCINVLFLYQKYESMIHYVLNQYIHNNKMMNENHITLLIFFKVSFKFFEDVFFKPSYTSKFSLIL